MPSVRHEEETYTAPRGNSEAYRPQELAAGLVWVCDPSLSKVLE